MAKLTFYVQALPYFYGGGYLRSELTLGNVTAKKPKKPLSNAKVVKIVLNIPDSVFKEAIPTINLDVPVEHITSISGETREIEEDVLTPA